MADLQHRKAWNSPEIVMEQELVARAQEPTDDVTDPFLGPLSTSGT